MNATGRRPPSLLADSLRAHALLFERPLAPQHDAAAGRRLFLAFVAVAFGLFFGLRLLADASGVRGLPATALAFVAALMLAFVVVHGRYVRLPFAAIGLRRTGDWSRRERLYLLQVAPLAALIFAFVFRDHLAGLMRKHGVGGFLLFSLGTGVLWGMVQEFLYRGWLQTELSRRFGATMGLVGANLVFTFGPLHLDHLVAAGGVRWGILGAIFAIGLVFGLLYQRSGNLWIAAVLHGLWPPNMN